MKRLTIEEQKQLGDIYDQIMINEMDTGDVLGSFTGHGGDIEITDFYAPGDTRRPKLLGGVQTRKGILKKKSKKRKKLV